MGGGGGAGQVKGILEWLEGPIFYHSNTSKWQLSILLPDILYRIFCLCRSDNSQIMIMIMMMMIMMMTMMIIIIQ